jgi:hypothetical protein
MRVLNTALLKEFRVPRCEVCGQCRGTTQPHHIRTRGAGGSDVRINLIALCWQCHGQVHAGPIHTDDLVDIVVSREGLEDRAEFWARQNELLRLPKGSPLPEWCK